MTTTNSLCMITLRGTQFNKSFYWPSEVALLLGVSKTTVYRWIEKGTLRPMLNIRPHKIPRDELLKLVSPQ